VYSVECGILKVSSDPSQLAFLVRPEYSTVISTPVRSELGLD